MRIRTILKALLFAYLITGIYLVLLALLLFWLDAGEKVISAGILLGYVLSSFAGGFMAGHIQKRKRYLWGLLAGSLYGGVLFLVSVICSGRWDLSLSHALTVMLMCMGGGMLGGILS